MANDAIAEIQQHIKEAMLAKDQFRLDVLRMLKTAIKNAEIASSGKPLTSEAILSIIQKQIKQRQDAAKQFEEAGRNELAEKEQKEIEILSVYVPKQIGDDELETLLSEILSKQSFKSKSDFGNAMKVCREAVQGKADNKRISDYLKRVLQ